LTEDAPQISPRRANAAMFARAVSMPLHGLCTKNTSWALIERPYSCAPQAVGAVYEDTHEPRLKVNNESSQRI